MVRKFASHLEAIEWLKQSAFENDDDNKATKTLQSTKLEDKLAHRAKIILVSTKVKGVRRSLRYCGRCGVSWPCLVAQEEAIERGQRRRIVSDGVTPIDTAIC